MNAAGSWFDGKKRERTSESQFKCEWMAGVWFCIYFVGAQMYSNFHTKLNDFIRCEKFINLKRVWERKIDERPLLASHIALTSFNRFWGYSKISYAYFIALNSTIYKYILWTSRLEFWNIFPYFQSLIVFTIISVWDIC
jgi:hypothetical protein